MKFPILNGNLLLELSVIPMDLILLVFVLGTYKENDQESEYRFKIFATLVTIGTILNVVTCYLGDMGNSIPLAFRLFFNTLDCLMGACSAVSFYLYMLVFAGVDKPKKNLLAVSYFLNIIYVLILLINLFTGIVFSYSSEGEQVHGLLYLPIYYGVPLMFVMAGVMAAFIKKKFFTKVQRAFLGIGLISVLILTSINLNSSGDIRMFYYIGSIGMFMVFLTLETPDYIKLLKILKELETARNDEAKALAKVRASDEAKSRFLTHLSHEIKTPLNSILGFSNEIIGSDVSPDVRKNAENVYKGARRLNQFFSDIVNNMAETGELDESGMLSLEKYTDELGKRMPAPKRAKAEDKTGKELHLSTDNPDWNEDHSSFRLLCVDDNELNLELLIRTLKSYGFTVDGAVNGAAALELIESNSYDAIFMDHMMPVMDGVETLHRIREDRLCDSTPVIVVTANDVKGEREKYLNEGFDEYVPKPFSGETLIATLRKVLNIEVTEEPADEKEAELQRLPEYIRDNPLIDVKTGLKNCVSADGFIEIAEVFSSTYPAKAAEINGFYENKDLKGYTVKVHALKSSAMVVGAAELFEMAKALELAAKNNNMSYIDDKNAELLEKYREVAESLKG
ncbi:MAG: response regulator [Lachnospiraceae bacterium]|nr:response regulator [Lachnospiraceae bacterium]